jgi:hypothetical protein
MKKNLRVHALLPLLTIGAVWSVLFGFTSISRADITVADNLDGNTNLISNYTSGGTEFKAQMFMTGAEGGDISFLNLYLTDVISSGTPTINVYVYNVTGGSISSSAINLLGTVTLTPSSGQTFAVNIENNINLLADSEYAIAIDTTLNSGSGTVGWAYFNKNVTGINFSGDGTMPSATNPGVTGNNGDYNVGGSNGNNINWLILNQQERLMDIGVVPEPNTSAIIGIGALCIAAGRILRRRKAAVFPAKV